MDNTSINKRVSASFNVIILILMALFSSNALSAPKLLYTDILSGPNTGGEGGNGIYLSIFGVNFGASKGSSQVTINGKEVATYKYWSDNQITIQPGSNITSGNIMVAVGGEQSNIDHTFTVRGGDIYFVSLTGNDSNAGIGNINAPFRNAQNTFNRSDFGPGDFLVLRGGTWTDVGDYGSRFININKSGTNGNPLTLMGYPGEQVIISAGTNHGFRFYKNNVKLGYAVISGFDIRVTGGRSCIGIGYGSFNIRLVNNEAQGQNGLSGGSGCFTGSASRLKILGNIIHDNGTNKLYHAIYIDNIFNDTVNEDVEIAYNHIYNQKGGRGIQIYWEQAYRISFRDFKIHHNLIHDIERDGITLGNQSSTGFLVYNNVIYRAGTFRQSALRFSGRDLEAVVYNNTIYDSALNEDANSDSGVIWLQDAKSVVFSNNIVVVKSPSYYFTNDMSDASSITGENNIWFGAGSVPGWSRNSLSTDPKFVGANTYDFQLSIDSPATDAGISTVLTIVTDDFNSNERPQGASIDIGAFETVGNLMAKPINVMIQKIPKN